MMTRLSAYALLLAVLTTTHAFAPHRRAHASLLRAAPVLLLLILFSVFIFRSRRQQSSR